MEPKDFPIPVEWARSHARHFGEIIGSLITLEMLARKAVIRISGQPTKVDLCAVLEGELVPVDPLTSYDSLGKTLKAYNRAIAHDPKYSKYNVDRAALVKLRDAIAHGRVFVCKPGRGVMKLVKCGRPRASTTTIAPTVVPVETVADMTEEWFGRGKALIDKEMTKVVEVADYGFVVLGPSTSPS